MRGAIIAVLAVIALSATILAIKDRGGSTDAVINKFNLALPTQGLTSPGGTRFAWAPDGRAFVYVGPGPGGSQLWLRSLDALEPTPVQGTEGGGSPFFSPDGTRIGFITVNPFAVRLVPRTGGNVTDLVTTDLSGGGGYWGADGFIYFDGNSNLSRIRPDGSGREIVSPLDTLQREIGVAWPQPLPDGRGVLFRVRRTGEDPGDYTVMVLDLHSRVRKMLVRGVFAQYSPTGHLLYVTGDGALMAAKFDLKRLEIVGAPTLLFRGIGIGGFGVVDLAVSSAGSLLYTTGHKRQHHRPDLGGSRWPRDTGGPGVGCRNR